MALWSEQIGFVKYAVITEVEGVKAFAELGIIFLLFTIGLELTIHRLWAMRNMVFGLGFSQVLICGAIITVIAMSFGNSVQASILIGACLALSSTAMVIQLLIEKGRFSSPVGQTSFSILLFQDLAVIPIILLVGIFGAETSAGVGTSIVTAIATAVAAIGIIVSFGKIVLRPLFRLVTFKHSPEFFMAMTLLILILAATGTAAAGLSMALGAFLAGLLLAETEFRHQIEVDIEPFKGLFMGLFFMSIGMAIDMRTVWNELFWLCGSVLGLYAIKTAVITALCLIAKKPFKVALPVGLMLGQGGEFAFVVIAIALQASLIPADVAQFMIVTASLSMICTPFVAIAATAIMDYYSEDLRGEHPYNLSGSDEELSNHIIIAGFGRTGQSIARMLSAQQVRYLAMDRNGPLVMRKKHEGYPVIYGNSSRKEVLRALGADQASALVVTVDDQKAAEQTVRVCREEWPDLPVFVKTHDPKHEEAILTLGATRVVGEISESSLLLAGYVLHQIGTPIEALNNIKEEMQKKEQSAENEDEKVETAENKSSEQPDDSKTAA